MNILSNYFNEEQISLLDSTIPSLFKNTLIEEAGLVTSNLEYLKGIGVTNLFDIFKKYYDMFLMDNTEFINVFNKYDLQDLIEKLNKNVAIIEFL